MISFRHVKKSFADKAVLRDVSFDVQDGEVFFIIGQSGVGKSVLIKHLVGLLYPDGGEIWLDGEEISRFDEARMYPVRMKSAMVFQHSTLFDSMTCAENVALPLRKHKGLRAREALSEAHHRLTQVHMQDFADRIVMLYQGLVRLIGSQDDFKACPDGIVQQFITGRAEGPIE